MQQEAPTTAVLLDLDDTLFDHSWSALAGVHALREGFAALARFTPTALAKIHARNLEAVHELVLAGEIAGEEARLVRFRSIGRDCGAPSLDPAELAAVYRAAYLAARRPVPGALELLNALRGRARIAVVTNNVLVEQTEKLRHLGMSELVDALVTSEETRLRKPDPAIFHLALARCGASAGASVMLGDSWGADVLGARAAGIRAVWLNREGKRSPAPRACAEIASLAPTAVVLRVLLGAG